MFEEKKYYCPDLDTSFSDGELEKFFIENCDDYDGDFAGYVKNCLAENNGALYRPRMISAIYEHGKPVFMVWNIKTDLY